VLKGCLIITRGIKMTDKKQCGVCDKPYIDHNFKQLKECWHKAKGYHPEAYTPDPKYKKGMDSV
jgi:hypothetical protein|tara:strand:- start:99 stop:290 length:192 start_codon:yes stop_codon:yes gene_type:complete